jgi:hypothetical protein
MFYYLADSNVPQTGSCRSSKNHVEAKCLRSRSHVHVNFTTKKRLRNCGYVMVNLLTYCADWRCFRIWRELHLIGQSL